MFNPQDFKTYLFSYNHAGKAWGLQIRATSPEDAKARIAKLAWASYDGEVVARIPASVGPLAMVVVAVRNALRRPINNIRQTARHLYHILRFEGR